MRAQRKVVMKSGVVMDVLMRDEEMVLQHLQQIFSYYNYRQMRERSAYRSTAQRVSPRREIISQELDQHSNRIKELLRADLIMLEEENAMLKAKCKKVHEQEQKIEMILKQNNQLLSQNERLSKLLHQKKQEYQIIRDKFEVQSNQKIQYATELEYQRKKLLNELAQLETELKEVEHIKNNQINELKQQFQIEVQAVKRQSGASYEIYEQEIRKLKDQLDKKDYQLSDAINRLKRFSSEAEYDILRLKEEKEKLRSELLYVETDKKKQLESLRSKIENNYLEEIESIKKNHLASLEGFQVQNLKLKDLVQTKNIELEQLSAKLNKQKYSTEESIGLVRRENQSLRSKLVQFQRLSESEKDSLKLKLNKVHQSELEEMRINQQKYVDCLQNEITKIEQTLNKKNQEIEQLIKQKASVRQMFDSEGSRLKEEIDTLHYKIKDLEAKNAENIAHYQEKIRQKVKHNDYLDKLNREQTESHDNQLKTMKQIIDHQKSELESERLKLREKDQYYQQAIDELKADNSNLKQGLAKEKLEKDKQIDDLTYELEGQITSLKTRVQSLSSRNNILERELTALKETIVFKDKQIKGLQERVRVSEDREKKLERQNDELRSKLIKKDQKTNQMLAQQKQRLDATFAFTIDSLKIDHEAALRSEYNKQVDQADKLKRKEAELDDLLRAYKRMREEMEVLTEQEANKKQMTLKYPGATADLIATKNLFDVYLKSRVLDICGDVRDKENKK